MSSADAGQLQYALDASGLGSVSVMVKGFGPYFVFGNIYSNLQGGVRVSFFTSRSQREVPFYLSQTDDGSGETIYFWSATRVPEPGSLGLLGLGLAMLGVARRRPGSAKENARDTMSRASFLLGRLRLLGIAPSRQSAPPAQSSRKLLSCSLRLG